RGSTAELFWREVEEDVADGRLRAAQVGLEPFAQANALAHRHLGRKAQLEHDEDGFGPELKGEDSRDRSDLGMARQHVANRANDELARRLADDQAARLVTEQRRLEDEHDADEDRRDAFGPRRVQVVAQRDGGGGEHQTDERGGVFEDGHEDRRILARSYRGQDGAAEAPLSPIEVELVGSDDEGAGLERGGDSDDEVARPRLRERARMNERPDALVRRQTAAGAEDDHRHHEAPEIELHAMPER